MSPLLAISLNLNLYLSALLEDWGFEHLTQNGPLKKPILWDGGRWMDRKRSVLVPTITAANNPPNRLSQEEALINGQGDQPKMKRRFIKESSVVREN